MPLTGKKERRDFDRGQGLAQFRFSFFSNVSKETESEMHLLWAKPADAAQIWIELGQRAP